MIHRPLIDSPEELPESPIHGMVPKTRWKNGIILGIIFTLWSTLTGLGFWSTSSASDYPVLNKLLDLEHGTLWTCWSIMCLLFTAQLAYINYWYRSHGEDDFKGYYRTWLWVAMASSGVAFLWSSGSDQLLTQAFCQLTHWHEPRAPMMIWAAALAALQFELCRKVDQEMGDCPWGLTLLYTFVVCSLFTGMLSVINQTELLGIPTAHWLTLSISLTSLTCCLATWTFTRRCLYVTAEPAPRRHSSLCRGLKMLAIYMFRLSGKGGRSSYTRLKHLCAWIISFFAKREVAPTKSKKATTTRKTSTAKASTKKAPVRKRKLKEEIEEVEKEEVEEDESEEATDDSYEEEEAESESESGNDLSEEEWLAAEMEREEESRRQLEAQQQQRNNKAEKPRIRLDSGSSYNQQPHASQANNNSYNQKPQQSYQQSRVEEEQSDYNENSSEDNGWDDGGLQIDPELMRGLSKKERRKLKQQMREKQRMEQ
jgi:hypothetical protein